MILIVANFIYLVVNFEKIASYQMKASVVDENYRFIIDEIIEKEDDSEEMQKKRRAYGAVIGAFVGDAAGAVLEFSGR